MDINNDLPDFPGEIHQDAGGKTSFIVTNVDKLANWARSNSIWPLIFGTSCCAIEMMSAASAKYDWSRFGFEVARATPRQADLIIVAGTICLKMVPVLKRLYDQMPEPKYVIAMGACTITGGPFAINSYSVLKGVDKILPVDVYVPGCPPRPEALLNGMMELQKKIKHSRAYVIDKQKKIEVR
jgi:NADH-quinone oxidoreductase subunit B